MQDDTQLRLAEFYELTESRFRQAAGTCGGPLVVDHRIAGRRVRMRFACASLLSAVGPAFAHLRAPADAIDPELTISLWDSRTSGAAMPRPLWSVHDYTARGDILGHDTRRFRTSFHTHSGIFNMADLETGRAIYWIRDAAAVPGYATSMPLLPILHWWMARLNMQLVHAGVVGAPDGAALLAGPGGAGKSNTALACLASGLDYVSDDFCLVELDPRPRAHSVFCTGRLHAADLEQQPFLRPLVSNGGDLDAEKAILFLDTYRPELLAADLPLRVILLLRVGSQRRTTWEPASPAAAHRALTAVTLHTLPGAGHAALDAIARTVRSLPCYQLHLGTDRTGVPAAVRTILEQSR